MTLSKVDLCIISIIVIAVLMNIGPHNSFKVEDEELFDVTYELEEKSPTSMEEPIFSCITPDCFETASRIIDNMDQNVKPCDDFYEFACGNFLRKTHIPRDRVKVDIFTLMNEEIQEQLRESLEDWNTIDEPRHVKLVKNLYKSCLNKQALEKLKFKPVLKTMEEMGGWPVLMGNRWHENDFHWIKSVYKSQDVGYSVNNFIKINIGIDMKNTSRRIIQLDQPQLGLPREIFTNGVVSESVLEAYHDYMVDVAVHFGASEEVARKELSASLEFEKQLATISTPEEKRNDITTTYNPMTIRQLSHRYPTIPWRVYINRLLAPEAIVDDDEIVNVMAPSYLKAFVKLIQIISPRIQANYAMWKIAMESIPYLDDMSREPLSKYLKKLDVNTQSETRWKSCINVVMHGLPLALSSLYVKRYFRLDAKESAVEIVNNIKNEFNGILKKADWMDEDTRGRALDKAASMSVHIGYPDEILDDNKVDGIYEDLELSDDNYLQNMLNLRILGTNSSSRTLRTVIDKSDWMRYGKSMIIGDFSIPTENSIQFPAAIFQRRIFNKNHPKYINYGGIGYLVGHEIAEAFGNQGRQFDKNGNKNDWWTSSTQEKFIRKAECLIDQYSNFMDAELDGTSTMDENIADIGGIKAAYLAYDKWASEHGEEPSLPRLHYTSKQLFWISAANVQCSKYQVNYLKAKLKMQRDSPAEFRVLGPFSNMIEFANDFNCPKGSKMNPVNKNILW